MKQQGVVEYTRQELTILRPDVLRAIRGEGFPLVAPGLGARLSLPAAESAKKGPRETSRFESEIPNR
jgi:hypothetical protein